MVDPNGFSFDLPPNSKVQLDGREAVLKNVWVRFGKRNNGEVGWALIRFENGDFCITDFDNLKKIG